MSELTTVEKNRCAILARLARAVEEDHPCDDTQGCDIALALEQGHVAWAAHLLTGATECPATEAIYDEFTRTFADHVALNAYLDAEAAELCKLPHWTCEKCGSVQWADPAEDNQCTDCLAPYTAPADKTEEV